jgi:hypothetical protein
MPPPAAAAAASIDVQVIDEFMAWFAYCDALVASALPDVGAVRLSDTHAPLGVKTPSQALVAALSAQCLVPVMCARLEKRAERVAAAATQYLHACLASATSPRLVHGAGSPEWVGEKRLQP